MQEVQATKQVETLPEPTEYYRGKIYVLSGGEGAADVSYICMKNAADTYEWVVSLGGGGSDYELPQATETVLGGIKASPKNIWRNSRSKD